jgi:hypothetical protein
VADSGSYLNEKKNSRSIGIQYLEGISRAALEEYEEYQQFFRD